MEPRGQDEQGEEEDDGRGAAGGGVGAGGAVGGGVGIGGRRQELPHRVGQEGQVVAELGEDPQVGAARQVGGAVAERQHGGLEPRVIQLTGQRTAGVPLNTDSS